MTPKISSIKPNIEGVTPSRERVARRDISFAKLLEQSTVKFSLHAQQRLKLRNIQLTPQDFQMLNNAVNKAAEKGAQESLILLDNLALVVSVKNRTVITAIDRDSIKENVITNIDSAVIMPGK